MKKFGFFFLLFFSLFEVGFSQSFKGKILYLHVRNTYYDKSKFSATHSKYELFFSKEYSYFNNFAYADSVKSTANVGGSSFEMKVDTEEILVNTQTNELTYRYNCRSVFPVSVFVVEPKPIIEWQIHQEIKKIGKFSCLKATAEFRGRKWTAWYTPEIPVNHGPWKLQGLPGLILQAHDELNEVQFLFTSIEIPFDVNKSLSCKEEGTQVSFEDYKQNPDGFWTKAAEAELSERLKTQVKITKQAVNSPIELSF